MWFSLGSNQHYLWEVSQVLLFLISWLPSLDKKVWKIPNMLLATCYTHWYNCIFSKLKKSPHGWPSTSQTLANIWDNRLLYTRFFGCPDVNGKKKVLKMSDVSPIASHKQEKLTKLLSGWQFAGNINLDLFSSFNFLQGTLILKQRQAGAEPCQV